MENKYSLDFSFTQEDVKTFAKVSGDFNPVHLDENYAANTIFKKRIVHGFLGASVFSRIFGTLYPGGGTIYLKQDLKFLAPMYVDTKYKAEIELTEVVQERKRARVRTYIHDEFGNIIIDGEAVIQNQIFGK
jgi:3-hydroxybutyryl-CoA dehydratase